MAYIHGAGQARPAAQKAAAAALAGQHLATLLEALSPLEAKAKAAFMAEYLDGICDGTHQATAAVMAANGKPGVLMTAGKAAGPSVINKAAQAGGRDRVSKKKSRARCHGCGSAMKLRDVACRRCGRPAAVSQTGKAMQAVAGVRFVGKSAKPRCPRCQNVSCSGAKHCTSCGSALLTVVKSAADVEAEHWALMWRTDPNPVNREMAWYKMHPDLRRPGTGGRAS